MAGRSEWTCEGDPKDFRVGVDGDLTRYPAESHGCAMTEGVDYSTNARWYRRSVFSLLSLQ